MTQPTAPGPVPLPAQRASRLRRLFRMAPVPSMDHERADWRRRLEAIGFTRERAEALEAHRWASWLVLRESSPRTPAAYAAWMCPWFERLWKETR